MANSDDYTQPIVTTPLVLQTLRASAALPAAGAWTTPLEIFAPTFDSLCLLFAYTRGGAAGAFDWKIEVSPDQSNWYQTTLYKAGVMAAGADTVSNVQREIFTYTATGAAIEKFVIGPLDLFGVAEKIRVTVRESGNVGAPGTLAVFGQFK